MQTTLYSQKGEEAGKIILPPEIFSVSLNADLLHQAVVTQLANRRIAIAHTKTRGEVSGGGKKPWRQKGTGRARHGSIRSPLWIGGGITFGPRKERVFSKKINRKAKRKALFMALSEKLKQGSIFFLDNFEFKSPKTKKLKDALSKFKLPKTTLMILPEKEKNIFLAARNLKNLKIIEANSLNVVDVLTPQNIILTKACIDVIKQTYLKNEKVKSQKSKVK